MSKGANYMREYRAKMIAEGKCVTCTAPNDRVPMRTCSACSAHRSAVLAPRKREKYAELKAQAKCVECGAPHENASRCNDCLAKRGEAERSRRASRVAAKVCSKCGAERDRAGRLCSRCYEYWTPEDARERNARLQAKHLCIQCSEPHGGKGMRCPTCSQHDTSYMRGFVDNRKKAGLCTACGKPNDRDGKNQCSECAAEQAARGRARYAARLAQAACTRCGTTLVFGRRMCFDCWCASTANNTINQWDRGSELKALWERQGGLCALTGEPLDATASLDHIVPQSRGGTHDIENLRWTHAWANYMKNNSTDDEFFDRCERILRARKP